MAMFIAMSTPVNIGELKNRLSEFLERAEKGDEILVCKRNVPFATITGLPKRKNRSQPGWAVSSLKIVQSVEGPAIPENDWNMLGDIS
jgi:prevent-host-death family protein